MLHKAKIDADMWRADTRLRQIERWEHIPRVLFWSLHSCVRKYCRRREKCKSMRGAMPFLVVGGALHALPANYLSCTFHSLSASHTCKHLKTLRSTIILLTWPGCLLSNASNLRRIWSSKMALNLVFNFNFLVVYQKVCMLWCAV